MVAVDKDKRIKELEAQVEALREEFDTFTYIVTHDIAAPVRGMSGYASLLTAKYSDKLDDKGRLFLDNIDLSNKKFYALMAALSQYLKTRINQDNHSSFSSAEVIKKVLGKHDNNEKTQLVIIDEKMPILNSDESHFHYVINALIQNAVKFREEAQDTIVEISYIKEDNYDTFCIKDNGIGIKEQFVEKIFTIFRKLNIDSEYPGVGLGLAMSKKIADLHNGKIWLESKEGEGSKFFFSLPKASD